jgi:AraC-like DNA-binding protein
MKPIREVVASMPDSSFHCREKRLPAFDASWHFHPELELTLVLHAQGYRIVGDHIAPLVSGDLVFVGANVPHAWYHDRLAERRERDAHWVVLHFREDLFGEAFWQLTETETARRVCDRARRGLHVQGKTRDLVAAKMKAVASGRGMKRIIGLLAILDVLAHSDDLTPIITADSARDFDLADETRVGVVCRYINAHLTEDIDRDALASLVKMTPNAFSRYFKTHTTKTLPDFVNDLRVARACHLLTTEAKSIGAIAFACGFGNLANFYRQFGRRLQQTPQEYRRRFRRANQPAENVRPPRCTAKDKGRVKAR